MPNDATPQPLEVSPKNLGYGPFELVAYPCSLCGSSSTESISQKAGRATGATFSIVRCAICAHVYVNPRIADNDLGALYDDRYYRGEGFDETVDYASAPNAFVRRENADIIATIRDALDRRLEGARWLELGCGGGTLLEAIRSAGADGVGYDESPAALNTCARRGLPVLDRHALDASRGTYDVVSAIQVIEHVADPAAFVRYLASFVRPGGIVYVHTENWNVVRCLPGTPYLMPEGHIQYFTPVSMRALFARCGLIEVPVFNRVWFVWRRLPEALRRLVPSALLPLLRVVLVRLLPQYATFPVVRTPAP